MNNEQLDEIAIRVAREIGEYSLVNYHDTFKLFARRLLAEVQKMQEPVVWIYKWVPGADPRIPSTLYKIKHDSCLVPLYKALGITE